MRVAVVGASGYSGLELLRILLRHPQAEIVAVTSEQRAGERVGEAFPSLRGLLDLELERADPEALAGRADFAFSALPHGTAAKAVVGLRKAGIPVADLSADFRLRDAAAYERWYGEHAAPELFGRGVYGLPEVAGREALRGAELVAVPGCYPTAALLPLAPFLRAGAVASPPRLVVDAKSGVTGAGRKLEARFLFAELEGDSRAYGAAGAHRHVPEIEEQIGGLAGAEARVTFTPHLLPTARGIVCTVYAEPSGAIDAEGARGILAEAYAHERFVRVLPPGETPSLVCVRGSNFCDVQALVDERTGRLVLLSAIDNLGKGAAGQAVQCMNLACGVDESAGLLESPAFP